MSTKLDPLKINLPNYPERLIGEYMDWLFTDPRVLERREMDIIVSLLDDSHKTTAARFEYQGVTGEDLQIEQDVGERLLIAAELVRTQLNATQDVTTVDYRLYTKAMFEIINDIIRKAKRKKKPMRTAIHNCSAPHRTVEEAEDELYGISHLDIFIFGYVDADTRRVHSFYEDGHPHLPVMGNQERVKITGRFSHHGPIT